LETRLTPSIYTVNSAGDTGSGLAFTGDLRYCLTQANASGVANTIQFDPTVFAAPQVISLQNALPAVTDNGLVIQGPGAPQVFIAGNKTFPIFQVSAANASFSGLTITGGSAFPGTSSGMGGGIAFTGSGVLTISNTVLSGNFAYYGGGGISNAVGTVKLSGCTLSGNGDDGSGKAGGILNQGMLSLVNSTLSGNTADRGAALYNSGTATLNSCTVSGSFADTGGGIINSGMLTLNGSTIASNKCYVNGGALLNNGTATLTQCTLSGNSAIDSNGNGTGGGVFSSGTLQMTDCTLSRNTAYDGGGLANSGTATLTGCAVFANLCERNGGGICNEFANNLTITNSVVFGNTTQKFGGGICNGGPSPLTLTGSAVSGNSAPYGGGIFLGQTALLTLTNSTLSGNSAAWEGGGLYLAPNSSATLVNSTLSGDSVSGKGLGGGIFTQGGLSLTNSTLSGNYAYHFGGGVYSLGTTALNNTLIASNKTAGFAPDILAPSTMPVSGSFNLIGDGEDLYGLSAGVNGNQIGTPQNPINPLLTPLGSYGGPTQTLALLPGSPALGAGSALVSGLPGTDQRGAPRLRKGTIDIGAFESRGFSLTLGGTNQSAVVATAFANPLAVVVKSAFHEPVAGGIVSFTAPTAHASAVLSALLVTLDANGQAGVTATANTMAGKYTVSASVGAAALAGLFHLTNLAGAAAHFEFKGPITVAAGAVFSLTVTVVDPYGNLVSGFKGTIAFTSSDPLVSPGNGLPSGYTFTAADKGKHTFSMTLRTAGTQTVTVADPADQIQDTFTTKVT
jgi:hypothetical protein